MITEDYVSYKTAKLLKEKGFDENTLCKYAGKDGITEEWYDYYRERMVDFNWDEGHLIEPLTRLENNYGIYGNTIPAPTLQMAMKWLRKVHRLEIYPFHDMLQGNAWWYRIERNTGLSLIVEKEEDAIYGTYEQACEEAIKYCLEHLI